MTDWHDDWHDDWLIQGANRPPDNPDRASQDVWADRLLRELRRHRDAVEVAATVATVEMVRVREWLEEERARHDTSELERLLAEYHAQRLEVDPRAKTVRLPSGELRARTADKWEWGDDTLPALLASPNTDLIRRTEKVEVDKAVAKKVLRVVGDGRVVDPDGVIVPGVTVETVTSFTVVTE